MFVFPTATVRGGPGSGDPRGCPGDEDPKTEGGRLLDEEKGR